MDNFSLVQTHTLDVVTVPKCFAFGFPDFNTCIILRFKNVCQKLLACNFTPKIRHGEGGYGQGELYIKIRQLSTDHQFI